MATGGTARRSSRCRRSSTRAASRSPSTRRPRRTARNPLLPGHAEGFKADGTAPTLLYGYGGYEVSQTPNYNPTVGASWLERGGVYALANIRGGGEFGPAWHQAAMRENHMRNFEDFSAVART